MESGLIEHCDQLNCKESGNKLVKYRYAYGMYCATHAEYHQGMIDLLRKRHCAF